MRFANAGESDHRSVSIWEIKMADSSVVHIGLNSPEEVAYKLLVTIANNEKKTLRGNTDGPATAERKWLLDTYAECLMAVQDPFRRLNP